MGFTLKLSGANINIFLENYEITGYDYDYHSKNSKYAKDYDDTKELSISGDISRIIQNNKQNLEAIRKWADYRYKDETYYTYAEIIHSYHEELIRQIIFPQAFVRKYTEIIDPNTGHGKFELLLLQKQDKRIETIFNLFYEMPKPFIVNIGNKSGGF